MSLDGIGQNASSAELDCQNVEMYSAIQQIHYTSYLNKLL